MTELKKSRLRGLIDKDMTYTITQTEHEKDEFEERKAAGILENSFACGGF